GDFETFGTAQSAWIHTTWLKAPRYRAGSYGFNGFILSRYTVDSQKNSSTTADLKTFRDEGQIESPTLTPLLGDCVNEWGMANNDLNRSPPPNPIYGGEPASGITGLYSPVLGVYAGDMGLFTIARHGKRPSPLPRQWDVSQPLFGAINMSFFD